MNRAKPNQERIPRGGTKMQQKPMPKQDKGGGIFPTGEGARFWPWERHGEVPFVASPLAVSRPSLALNTRETRG